MSLRLMTAVWLLPIRSTAKFVLLALCDNANEENWRCFLLVKTLAKKCSLSERAVQLALSELEQLGYIERQERRGRSTIFIVNHPRIFCTPADAAPTPADRAPTLEDPAPTPANPAPIIVSEPYSEPSREHIQSRASAPRMHKASKDHPKSGDQPEGFAEFLAAYPECARDRDRHDTEREFRKLLARGHLPQQMVEGAKRYAIYCASGGVSAPKYVKSPRTFLAKRNFFESFTPQTSASDEVINSWLKQDAEREAQA